MKKISLLLVLIILFFVSTVFADRDTATVTTYKTTQLVKRGDAKIYSVSFVATANGGNFIIQDATSLSNSSTKVEGSEVTSAGSQFQDFSNKPLEFGTGIYLVITSGYVTLRYE